MPMIKSVANFCIIFALFLNFCQSSFIEISSSPSKTFSVTGIDHLGKVCSDNSFYTRQSDEGCNGWAYTSFEECKTKCINNEVPDGCPRHKMPSNGCAFAVYDDNPGFSPGWCQLANESCVLSQRSTNSVWEKSKQGKCTVTFQFI